jgi:branched-subunit amino acid transport protein
VSTGTAWALVGLCALVTAAIKAAGPIALGGRELPDWFSRVIALMAPALLAALVCTAALADGERLAIGADTAGVAVAGLAFWRGASVIVAVILAAAITATLRAL